MGDLTSFFRQFVPLTHPFAYSTHPAQYVNCLFMFSHTKKSHFNRQLMHPPVYTYSPAQHLKCLLVWYRILAFLLFTWADGMLDFIVYGLAWSVFMKYLNMWCNRAKWVQSHIINSFNFLYNCIGPKAFKKITTFTRKPYKIVDMSHNTSLRFCKN